MNNISRIFAFILTAVIMFTAVGCSEPEPADEAEVHAAAKELVLAAVEVNRIFFWEGLPQGVENIDYYTPQIESSDVTETVISENITSVITESVTSGDESTDDYSDGDYIVLAEEYMFLTQDDLMAKAMAVYTAAYCEDIRKIGFDGIVYSEDDLLYPRYSTEMGVMKINRKLAAEGLSERIPRPDTIKTVSLKHNMAVVSMEFECEGKVERLEITLILENSGWRLDTPTY